MIVHRIDPHKSTTPPHVSLYKPPPTGVQNLPYVKRDEAYEYRVPVGGGYMVTKINEHTNKIVYAQWLSSLGFKRGDYVVHRRTYDTHLIRSPFNYLRVVQLQEVQMLVNYLDNGKAQVLELCSPQGTRFWTCPDEWVKDDPPDDLTWHFDAPTP